MNRAGPISIIERVRRTGRPARLNCPLCRGQATLSIRRGRSVDLLLKCFKCTAPYKELAIALGLPREQCGQPPRPPVRGESEFERACAELLQEDRERQAALIPWMPYLMKCDEVRSHLNDAKESRKLADVAVARNLPHVAEVLVREAIDHERIAEMLDLECDQFLAYHNDTLQAWLEHVPERRKDLAL